jgi:hypothetical protein
MPVSLCRAGIGCARAMAEFLGTRLHMVVDVHAELQRLARDLPALETLLEGWPPNPIRQLDLDLRAEVATAIKARHIPGQHYQQDRGEIATVFYASRRRDGGEIFDIVTDDNFGKELARDRGFSLVTTPSLAVQMVCQGALTFRDGKRVWQQCFTNRSRWKDFEQAVVREGGIVR